MINNDLYDVASEFYEGIAIVGKNDKYGFIDKTGKEIIPLKYDKVQYFSEGLAAVKIGGKWGYIDKNDKMVIPPKYSEAEYFLDGVARVFNYSYGLPVYAIIDKTGKEIVPLGKYSAIEEFQQGLAIVRSGLYFGVIDKTGKEIIPLKYDEVQYFSEGLAPVKIDNNYDFIKNPLLNNTIKK